MSRSEKFYAHVVRSLRRGRTPFLIGGTYAFRQYLNSARPTKDMDIFCKPSDASRLLRFAGASGFHTELTDKLWLGKIFNSRDYVDVIFRASNGKTEVTDDWFIHSTPTAMLQNKVRVISSEHLILSKVYVMGRDCFHGHDVYKLIHALGKKLDWRRIWHAMRGDWQVLHAQLTLFDFVFPRDRGHIPRWLRVELHREETRSLTR